MNKRTRCNAKGVAQSDKHTVAFPSVTCSLRVCFLGLVLWTISVEVAVLFYSNRPLMLSNRNRQLFAVKNTDTPTAYRLVN